MALLIREGIKAYHRLFELADPRVQDLPLMSSPSAMLTILAVYWYFVTDVGPRWMKNREPFAIDRIVQVYNVFQVVVNAYIAYTGAFLIIQQGHNWFCEPVDYSYSPGALQLVAVGHLYFLVKITDLLDTVFFVLRKRDRQITFLHLYHHTSMVYWVWIGVKFLAGGHTIFLGMLNAFVHVIMYTYYLLTSLYPQNKNNMWWKKYITQMQMVQFFLIGLHHTASLVNPNCDYPKWIDAPLVVEAVFMTAMFYDFYRKAYKDPAATTTRGKRKISQ